MACEYGYLAIVEVLVSQGLNSEDIRCVNNYALHNACANKHFDVVQELIFVGEYTPDEIQSLCGDEAIRFRYTRELPEPALEDMVKTAVHDNHTAPINLVEEEEEY